MLPLALRTRSCWLALYITAFLPLGGCDGGQDVPSATIQDEPATTPDPANESSASEIEAPSTDALAIDTTRSTFGFVGSKPTGSQSGSFATWTGTVELDASIEQTEVVIEIQMESVRTESDRLTSHLQSDDFFDTARFPTARFESTGFAPAAAGDEPATHRVSGRLTLRGQTQLITFPVRVELSDTEFRARAEFSIDRQRWGIRYPGRADDLIYDDVVIRFDVRAPR